MEINFIASGNALFQGLVFRKKEKSENLTARLTVLALILSALIL